MEKFHLISRQSIFDNFSHLLIKYKEPIINSFVMVEKLGRNGKYKSRLSNGPIESINRKVKDLNLISFAPVNPFQKKKT